MMVCLVCGKSFPKHQDLDRHMNATSIQHLYTNKSTHNYNFFCSICGNYFTKKEHLDQHLGLQLCKKSVPHKDPRSHHNSNEESKIDDVETKTRKELLDNKTIECMVCGKLFPRGAIDLQRHATAITLKHLISKKKNSMFPFGCSRCSLCFTTEEHMKSHEQFSTCNPNITWPDNASSTSGLRAIPRVETVEVGSVSSSAVTNVNPPSEAVVVSESDQLNLLEDGGVKRPPSDGDVSDLFCNSTRHKRAKIIIPEERKAFFSIVSLLMESRQIKVTEDNFEEFISKEDSELINALKTHLLCTS